MARSEIIEIARGWLGTPYHHQAAVRGTGADCIGFVKGVALEGGLITPELARGIPADYSRQQSGGRLRRLLGDLLIAVPDRTTPSYSLRCPPPRVCQFSTPCMPRHSQSCGPYSFVSSSAMKFLTRKGFLIEEQGMSYLTDTDPDLAL